MPLCAAYPRQYRLRALWLGRRPCLGEGRVPSPSSSSPRARFARILQSKTGLGQPSSPTPILVFKSVFVARFFCLYCKLTAALIQGRGRPSGNARRREADALAPEPARVRAGSPTHARANPAREIQKGSRAGLPTKDQTRRLETYSVKSRSTVLPL